MQTKAQYEGMVPPPKNPLEEENARLRSENEHLTTVLERMSDDLELARQEKTRAADDAAAYVLLRDEIIARFNPRDDDIAEEAIMMEAIGNAADFILGFPCLCTPGVITFDDQPCRRCSVLGMRMNQREDLRGLPADIVIVDEVHEWTDNG